MISVEVVIIAFALAMDAFAVAVGAGMTQCKYAFRTALVYGAFFGTFQFFMPLAGSLLHLILPRHFLSYSDLIAFVLLFIIGARMIYSAYSIKENMPQNSKPNTLPELIALSFATSIDALAAGTSLALMDVSILAAAATIGAIAFILSAAGALLGYKAAGLLKHSEVLGGAALIAISVWTLLF